MLLINSYRLTLTFGDRNVTLRAVLMESERFSYARLRSRSRSRFLDGRNARARFLKAAGRSPGSSVSDKLISCFKACCKASGSFISKRSSLLQFTTQYSKFLFELSSDPINAAVSRLELFELSLAGTFFVFKVKVSLAKSPFASRTSLTASPSPRAQQSTLQRMSFSFIRNDL
jgi:hypothetical protein